MGGRFGWRSIFSSCASKNRLRTDKHILQDMHLMDDSQEHKKPISCQKCHTQKQDEVLEPHLVLRPNSISLQENKTSNQTGPGTRGKGRNTAFCPVCFHASVSEKMDYSSITRNGCISASRNAARQTSYMLICAERFHESV